MVTLANEKPVRTCPRTCNRNHPSAIIMVRWRALAALLATTSLALAVDDTADEPEAPRRVGHVEVLERAAGGDTSDEEPGASWRADLDTVEALERAQHVALELEWRIDVGCGCSGFFVEVRSS